MSDVEFNQWFTGFTDGEGNFYVGINKNNTTRFAFSVHLHIDDIGVLEFIKSRLNCGNVYVSDKTATFYVGSVQEASNILIPLFDKFPLNGIKYLDYLAFKESVFVYLDDSLSKSRKLELITKLKDSMNTKRESFEMPESHTIRITPYWLLGLIEGEGSFCLNDPKNMGISFSLALTQAQSPLINAIKHYIDNYKVEETCLSFSSDISDIVSKRSYITNKKGVGNSKPAVEISVRQVNFIVEYFIPMMSGLSFMTKKHKDFLD